MKSYLQKYLVTHLNHQERKLINTTDKEEYQKIVENIEENKRKLHEVDETSPFNDYVIVPSNRRNNLKDVIDIILDFNKAIIQ